MNVHRKSETETEDESVARQTYKRIEPCAENSQIDAYQAVQHQHGETEPLSPIICERNTEADTEGKRTENQFESRKKNERYLKFICLLEFDYLKKREIE